MVARPVGGRPMTSVQVPSRAKWRWRRGRARRHRNSPSGTPHGPACSQGVATGDWRHVRYRGLARTRLQRQLVAAAMNLVRLASWFAERPRAATRPSPLATLAHEERAQLC